MRRFWQFSYCVPLPPPRSFPLWIKPQNFTSPALNGAHQAISEPYLTKAWKSFNPPPPQLLSSLHTSLFTHEMTPLFNQLWIMKFCTRDPFSLHLTVIELHSHAIPFSVRWEEKRVGEELHLCAVGDEGNFPVTSWASAERHRTFRVPLCALGPRVQVARWRPTLQAERSCAFVFATVEELFTNFLLRSPKDKRKAVAMIEWLQVLVDEGVGGYSKLKTKKKSRELKESKKERGEDRRVPQREPPIAFLSSVWMSWWERHVNVRCKVCSECVKEHSWDSRHLCDISVTQQDPTVTPGVRVAQLF